jgi:hypothetical protein
MGPVGLQNAPGAKTAGFCSVPLRVTSQKLLAAY